MDANPPTTIEMKTSPKRPAVVTIAAILLLILTLFVAGFALASQFGLIRGAGFFGRRQFTPGQFRGGNFTPPGGSIGNLPGGQGFPGGNDPNGFQGNGTGGANGFNGAPGANGFPNGLNGQGTRTFNRAGVAGIFRYLRFLQPILLGLSILLLILAVVAVVGLFMNRRWGSILAIVISALVILLTLPSMIRIFSTLTLVEGLFRILLSLAVIVLLLLPAARRPMAVAAADGEEEVERVVR